MFEKFIVNQLHNNIFNTALIIIALTIVYLTIRLILLKKIASKKPQRKVLARINYFFILLFLACLAKIWITGFTHFFYALSLVSAGLVVSNKETIMNFVGGMVITWRGLFAEGDYIKIGKHSGFVYDLGILYFKLLQSSEHFSQTISGKMIKIPNGLAITNPIINFSLDTNLIETTQQWLLTADSDIEMALEQFTETAKKVVTDYYKDNNKYALRTTNKMIAKKINLDINSQVNVKLDKPAGIAVTLCYYCFPNDRDIIQKKLFLAIYAIIAQSNSKIKLAFQNS